MKPLIFLIFVVFCVTPAIAGTTPTEAPEQSAPCDTPNHHAFDFWIGSWNVYAPDGTLVGTNEITSQEGGCLLLEKWIGTNGVSGQSYNFVDPSTEKWRQVWVSPAATIDYSGTLTQSGSMKLVGEIAYQSIGLTAPFRGEWTPNADGTVTQHFEQYDADTDTWGGWFTATYKRQASDNEVNQDEFN